MISRRFTYIILLRFVDTLVLSCNWVECQTDFQETTTNLMLFSERKLQIVFIKRVRIESARLKGVLKYN